MAQDAPRDRGIGGTGLAATAGERDRGIGGTGVVGTIRRFGSIYVNGLRITYPTSVKVVLDGVPGHVGDLHVGQVVRVTALGQGRILGTRRIDVTSEVVGPVEAMEDDRVLMMGQLVSTAALRVPSTIAVGDRVAVGGLRRSDGVVLATSLMRRPAGPDRVAGPVMAGSEGQCFIGRLPIIGLGSELIGTRAVLEGAFDHGVFHVASAQSEEALLMRGKPRRLLVEGYVARTRGELRLGSGLAFANPTDTGRRMADDRLAIVSVNVRAAGVASVTSVQADRGGSFPDGRNERPNAPNGPPGSSVPPQSSFGTPDGGGPLGRGPRGGAPGSAPGPGSGFGGPGPGRSGDPGSFGAGAGAMPGGGGPGGGGPGPGGH